MANNITKLKIPKLELLLKFGGLILIVCAIITKTDSISDCSLLEILGVMTLILFVSVEIDSTADKKANEIIKKSLSQSEFIFKINKVMKVKQYSKAVVLLAFIGVSALTVLLIKKLLVCS